MEFVVIGLILFFVLGFVACVFLYPELVGIAGKKAREIEDSHHDEKPELDERE